MFHLFFTFLHLVGWIPTKATMSLYWFCDRSIVSLCDCKNFLYLHFLRLFLPFFFLPIIVASLPAAAFQCLVSCEPKAEIVQLKGCSPTPRGKMFEFEARIKVLTRLLTATSPLCLSHCSHLEQSLTTLALQHTRCISDLWFLVVGRFREVRQ